MKYKSDVWENNGSTIRVTIQERLDGEDGIYFTRVNSNCEHGIRLDEAEAIHHAVAFFKNKGQWPKAETIEQTEVKMPDGFGKSTQRDFDNAIAALPSLIAKAREGDEHSGQLANDLLWRLANEGFNTRSTDRETFKQIFNFGRKEGETI